MTSPLAPSLFTLTEFARQHRKAPTASEALMWNALRDRRFRGIKFRRQHVASPFILDFFAHSLKLAIEIDGGSHLGRQALDAARDADLGRLYGIRVWRVSARRVETELAAVLRDLAVVL